MRLPFTPHEPWLAPLAGFSDLPFRLLCRELGAACAVTEMISAKGLVYGQRGRKADGDNTQRLLASNRQDDPLVVQLFGAEPEFLAEAVDILRGQGFAWFDLNCGCSVPKVTSTGAGAALLRTPQTLLACAQAMIDRAGPGRVGFKLRLGWTAGQELAGDMAPRLADLGAGWLTLHPRYAVQGFSGTANWDLLAAFVRRSAVPVLASGDLFCAADAARCMSHTGASGVMFARGALANPFIFAELRSLLAAPPSTASNDTLMPFSGQRLAWLIRRHTELITAHGGTERDIVKLRSILPRYVRDLPGSKHLRARMVHVRTVEDIMLLADEIALISSEPPAHNNA